MKQRFKLTAKFLKAAGLPAGLIDEIPEDLRFVERKYLDGTEPEVTAEYAEGLISTVDVDADGDVLIPDGIETARYAMNPVVLFNHDLNAPVGFSEAIRVGSDRVIARTKFGTTPECQKIYQLLKDRVLRTFSMGFIPLDAVLRGKPGFDASLKALAAAFPGRFSDEALKSIKRIVTRCMLIEYSVVTIPSNAHAVLTEIKSLKTNDDTVATNPVVIAEGPPQPAVEQPEKPLPETKIFRVGKASGIRRVSSIEAEETKALVAAYVAHWGI